MNAADFVTLVGNYKEIQLKSYCYIFQIFNCITLTRKKEIFARTAQVYN